MDNTWATPLFFPPHAHGVDLAIEAGTKYLSGHSDLLLGLVSANEAWFQRLHRTVDQMAIPRRPGGRLSRAPRLAHDGIEAARGGAAGTRAGALAAGAARGSARHPPCPARSSGPRAYGSAISPARRASSAIVLKPVVGGRGRRAARRARALRPRLFLGRLREPRRPVRLHVLSHRDRIGAGRPGDPLQRRPRGHRGFEGRPRPGLRAGRRRPSRRPLARAPQDEDYSVIQYPSC